MRLHITTHGHGKPLVLWHGWGYDQTVWLKLLPRLTPHYCVYLVDLPGFGLSDPMTWDVFKDSFLAQMPPTFAIVGWSMGGLFATKLAIEAPLRVTHVLNVASTPCFIQDDDWPGVERSVFQTFCDDFLKHPEKQLAQFTVLPQSLPVSGTIGLQAGLNALLTWDLRPELSALTVPICYLFGQLDTIISRHILPVIHARYPHVQCVLFRRAGHAPFLSHPTEYLSLLEGFLK